MMFITLLQSSPSLIRMARLESSCIFIFLIMHTAVSVGDFTGSWVPVTDRVDLFEIPAFYISLSQSRCLWTFGK